jgi:N-acetylglucosamine malate deacetylase 1
MIEIKTLRHWIRRLDQTIRSRQAYKFFIQDWTRLRDIDICADVLKTMRVRRLIEPLIVGCPSGRRILVIAPHPDDETIGPGGALLKAIDAGAEVHVIYLTTNMPIDATRQEADEISRKAGYSIEYLDSPVGNIPVDAAHAQRLAERVQAFAPDQLFLPFFMDDNNDHRRANELFLASQVRPLTPSPEIWAYQVYGVVPGNVIVDISDVAERKADLIRCWRTQMKRRDWAHYALGMNAFNSRFMRGDAERKYGEVFFVLPVVDYLDLCRMFFVRPENVYHPAYATKT